MIFLRSGERAKKRDGLLVDGVNGNGKRKEAAEGEGEGGEEEEERVSECFRLEYM